MPMATYPLLRGLCCRSENARNWLTEVRNRTTGGTARHVATDTGTITDSYTLEAFGGVQSTSGTTNNPYRGVYPERSRRGGAWGYITDPSGMLQLGARFYWPEVAAPVGA